MKKQLGFALLMAGASGIAALTTRQSANAAWKMMVGSSPPENPDTRKTTWPEALVFGAFSGALAGMVAVVARRYASAGWRHSGRRIPRGER
jgi:hypothetical protein